MRRPRHLVIPRGVLVIGNVITDHSPYSPIRDIAKTETLLPHTVSGVFKVVCILVPRVKFPRADSWQQGPGVRSARDAWRMGRGEGLTICRKYGFKGARNTRACCCPTCTPIRLDRVDMRSILLSRKDTVTQKEHTQDPYPTPSLP